MSFRLEFKIAKQENPSENANVTGNGKGNGNETEFAQTETAPTAQPGLPLALLILWPTVLFACYDFEFAVRLHFKLHSVFSRFSFLLFLILVFMLIVLFNLALFYLVAILRFTN